MDESHFPETSSPPRTRLWLGLGLLGLLLALGWVYLMVQSGRGVPAVGGGITLSAPGGRLYVGDRLVGDGEVTFTWEELAREPPAGLPGIVQLAEKEQPTAEMLAGPGAQVVRQNARGSSSTGTFRADEEEWILRRPDGTLDPVFTCILSWQHAPQPRRRLLLPVRVRQEQAGQPLHFGGSGHGTRSMTLPGVVRFLGKSPEVKTFVWSFQREMPPPDLAAAYREQRIWGPGPVPATPPP